MTSSCEYPKTNFVVGDGAPGACHKFSYISPQEFETFLKYVARERKKKKYEEKWNRYLQIKQAQEETNVESRPSFPELENGSIDLKESLKCYNDCGHLNLSLPRPTCCCECHAVKSVCEATPRVDNRSPVRPDKTDDTPDEENRKEKISLECQSSLKKIDQIRAKMIQSIQNLRTSINQPEVQLEEEDAARNRQRSIEFAARFKRNYHYQITCQLNDLRKLISGDISKKERIAQRFIAIHQVGLQALQAVEKHVVSTSHEGPFLWLKEFLSSVCDLSVLLAQFTDKDEDSDQLDDLEKCCVQFIDSIQELARKKEDEGKKRKKKGKSKNVNPIARDNLWMYRSHKTWKEKAAEMARARFTKRNNKKRDDGEEVEPRLTDKGKFEKQFDLRMEIKQREGSALRKSTRNVTEEQVRTMMEIVPESSESDCEGEREGVVTRPEECQQLPCKTEHDVAENRKNKIEQGNCLASIAKSSKPSERANVKLLIVKSDKEATSPRNDPSIHPEVPRKSVPLREDLMKYKHAFQGYQTDCEWYKPKVNESVEKISGQIINETLLEVCREMNFPSVFENIIRSELQERD